MADGSVKAIEDVEIGDWVWAEDPETGEKGARQVTDLIVGSGEKDLVRVVIDGHVITATDAHPFWVESRKAWVDAADLVAGDVVLTAAGDTLVIDDVASYTLDVNAVHNLTVADLHTYYVLAGESSVLVHNCEVGTQRWQQKTRMDGQPFEKPGPKVDPTAPHNAKIREVIQEQTAKGRTHVGGGDLTEMTIETPGGFKPYRRVDASFQDPVTGQYFHFNVGEKYRNVFRSGPLQREREALLDIVKHADPSHRRIRFVEFSP